MFLEQPVPANTEKMPVSANVNGDHDLTLCRPNGCHAYHLRGDIANFMLYDTPLNAEQAAYVSGVEVSMGWVLLNKI